MIAKHDIDPDNFFFDATLTATQIAALPGDVNAKNLTESKKKLKSILNLCIGEEAQRIFKARQPGVNTKAERYSQKLDHMESVFKLKRKVTHERGLFYGLKQREHETFEKFHAVLNALARHCNFTNKQKMLRQRK